MAKRPLIGITSTYNGTLRQAELWDAYGRAVEQGGGIPLILPPTDEYPFYDEYLKCLDGLVLSGGQDIMPLNYRQEPQSGFELTWQMEPRRDAFELEMARRALAADLPILGICRGVQLLAVACGGDLYQDVSFAWPEGSKGLRHYQIAPWELPSHSVEVARESLLGRILNTDSVMANSLHHQCVRSCSADFRAVGMAADGVIEALESVERSFVLGVQWHPERMFAEDAPSRRIFGAFVETCG
jgi:putative glutamine amidotransferase